MDTVTQCNFDTHFQHKLQLLRVRHLDGELHGLVLPRGAGPARHGRLVLGGAKGDYRVGVDLQEGRIRLETRLSLLMEGKETYFSLICTWSRDFASTTLTRRTPTGWGILSSSADTSSDRITDILFGKISWAAI